MNKVFFSRSVLCAIFLVGIFAPFTAARCDEKTYNETIVVPGAAGAGVKTTADVVAKTLEKVSGKPFAVKDQAEGPAIVLKYATDASAAVAGQLKDAGPEAYVIRSYEDKLYITANTDTGLVFGLYYYLDQIGVRWYFPTDKWTIIPQRSDIRLKVNKLRKPEFRVRSYFPTGGHGRAGINRFYDPQDKIPNAWAAWQTRNGFGGEFYLGGHAGEDFNLRNKKVLLEHPEYFAEMGGKRTAFDLGGGNVNLGAKHDVSNPGLVDLYVQDRIRKYEEMRAKDPNVFAVSVEPADGGGYATSGEAMKIGDGSASDQTYYLANKVAKALNEKYPGAHVSLLAYGFHLMPPSFDLEPNVFVTVVPYGFNYTGLSGDELLALWHKKLPNIGVYDYWAIPDWSLGMPNYSYLYYPSTRIRYWKSQNVVSFTAESSASAGAIGIAWYVASRLMWDKDTDVDALLAEFYKQAFGPAAVPMKRMLERWASTFLLTDNELAVSYGDMHEARDLAAKDSAVMARLDDYAAYLHFLRLSYEYRQDASRSTRPDARPLAYVEFMWRIYDTAMVEPFRLTSLITLRKADAATVAAFGDKNGEGWKNITPITHDELEALMKDGEEKYQPLGFETKYYGGKMVPLPADLAVNTTGGKPVTMFFFDQVSFELLVPAGMKSVDLNLWVGATFPMPVKLYDENGNKLSEDVVPQNSAGLVKLNFPKPGRYTVKFTGAKVHYQVAIPAGLHFTTPFFQNSQGQPEPRLYFYVPKGSKTVAFYLTYFMVPTLYDGEGKEQKPRVQKAPGIVVVDVPAGQDGKVWSMGNVKVPQPMRMLNVPSAFAVSPDQLLIPEDALKTAG